MIDSELAGHREVGPPHGAGNASSSAGAPSAKPLSL